jgi:hypothetical protein
MLLTVWLPWDVVLAMLYWDIATDYMATLEHCIGDAIRLPWDVALAMALTMAAPR